MKKSNKILIGGLLTIVLLLLSVHIALNARFKAGKFTSFNEVMTSEATQIKEFANAGSVDIRYLYNIHVRVGERFKVEHHGGDIEAISITEKGGTVFLAAKDSAISDRNHQYIVLYVPNNAKIVSNKAMLFVQGQKGAKISVLNVSASDSRVSFEQGTHMFQIDSLNVEGVNKSFIDFQNIHIDKLTVRLNRSEMREQGAIFNQFTLDADTTSQINLQSKNLIKLTTKTTAHE